MIKVKNSIFVPTIELPAEKWKLIVQIDSC
jgi:hypothetical protein